MARPKLVRDKVPRDYPDKPDCYHVADDDEYFTYLVEKLEEETVEYVASRELEELADMLEAIYALAANDGFTPEELEIARHKKFEKRGGFEGRFIWNGK
jgi:predicted house-cleaning noncanonical NTP pyrophosphatase (MazG superfamily)